MYYNNWNKNTRSHDAIRTLFGSYCTVRHSRGADVCKNPAAAVADREPRRRSWSKPRRRRRSLTLPPARPPTTLALQRTRAVVHTVITYLLLHLYTSSSSTQRRAGATRARTSERVYSKIPLLYIIHFTTNTHTSPSPRATAGHERAYNNYARRRGAVCARARPHRSIQ